MHDAVYSRGAHASSTASLALEHELAQFLVPFITWLDTQLDKRVVWTVLTSIVAFLNVMALDRTPDELSSRWMTRRYA